MKLARVNRTSGEGGLAFLIILLVIVGGILGWLYVARQDAAKNIRLFAAEVARTMAVDYDGNFLHNHLSAQAHSQFLRSWRDRLIEQLRGLGVPAQPIEVQGDVMFTSYFFDPHGTFRAQLKYPDSFAELELGISRGMTVWQVDNLALFWTPPPATPTPIPSPTVTPTQAPPQKAKRKTNR